jgi:hypothetical protein
MPNTPALPRNESKQVVNPVQNAVQPNRTLESKMDRMMFGALTSRPQMTFGLE